MAQGTLNDAVRAMNGRLVTGDPGSTWSGAAIDSRRVEGGELFFALPGERTDGHRFVAGALDRGAAAAIVHQDVEQPTSGGLIRVDDALRALHDLTSAVRDRLPERLVAITGSVGKTTTKELLALMLEADFRVARNPGNLNNLYGFPLSLLSIPEGTEWMVAEMGMSTPGELSRLSRIGRPDIAVLTNVRAVHLEFFDSVGDIARAKAELLEGLAPDGFVVANADDPEVMRVIGGHRGRVVRFGTASDAEHRAVDIEALPSGGSRFRWLAQGAEHRVELPLLGEHNVFNFLAAASCATEIGVAPARVLECVAAAVPAPGRGEVHTVGTTKIVDDSYNSNPAALSAALKSARALPGRRHWAVLGDMLELGEEGLAFHEAAGAEAVRLGFSPVFGVGSLSRALVDGARSADGEAEWFASAAEAAPEARRQLGDGDVVLVKGSRGVALDAVVAELISEGEGRC